MYSLGEKFRVLNTPSDVKFYTSANVEITDDASIVGTLSYFTIKGFGNFPIAKVTNFRGARAKAAALEVSRWGVVAPTGIVIGDTVEIRITSKTDRYQADLTNNFIGGGRPLVFQTAPLTAVNPSDIATAISAAFTAYKNAFIKADLFISTVAVQGGTNIDVTVASGYESVSVVKVEISISKQGAGNFPKTNLSKTTVTAGSEGRGLGKFLEESVRVGTADNVRTYGMNATADTSVDVRGSYTQFSWTLAADYDEVLGNVSSDIRPSAKHDFTLFLNEATCLATDSAIHLMAESVVLAAAADANVDLPVLAPGAVTTANYATIGLLIATDASVATSALFIA
jgi:hypothetical protein